RSRRASPRAARGVPRPRGRRALVSRARRLDGPEHQHAAGPQALRSTAPAYAPPRHLPGFHRPMRSHPMRRKKLVRIAVGFMVFAILFVTVFGWAVHQLWNVLMPEIFGLPQIGFWQAL